MIKTQKVLIRVLALVFVLTIAMTGCGTNATQQTTVADSTTAAPTGTTAEAALPPVELSWFCPVGTLPKEEDLKLVQEELNKYLAEKISAKVTLNFMLIPDWKQKSPVMIASGDDMDIIFTAGWDNYRKSVSQGAFVDITDMLDKYTPKTKALMPAAYLEGTKVNGRNYAIPTNKDLAHTYGVMYRTDIAGKYGLDFSNVTKIADLEPLLKVIKEKEPDSNPYLIIGGNSKNAAIEYLNFDPIGDATIPGKLYPAKDYKVVNEFTTLEAMEYYKVLRSFYEKGYIMKDAATITDQNPYWNSGKVYVTGAQGKPFVDEDITIQRGYPYKYIPYTKPFITGNNTQGSNQAIYRTSKNPERALMFLELLNTDPFVNNLVNYGVESKHYVKKSENTIDFTPGLTAKTSGYYPNAFWIFGNQFLNYFIAGQNTKRWEAYNEFNNSAEPSKILGFDFDQESVKTEIAACANVTLEFNAGLNTGTMDPEVYLPKLIDKLKAAGVDTIIAEKQKQIDAWLATKK